jgi:hypothetical protein
MTLLGTSASRQIGNLCVLHMAVVLQLLYQAQILNPKPHEIRSLPALQVFNLQAGIAN